MAQDSRTRPFSIEDFDVVAALVTDTWGSAVDLDWSVPAGTLEWSCWKTADHTVDCVFSYALFLASRRQEGYPPFDLLRALPEATPADLVEGLHAVVRMLRAVIVTSPPGTRAVLTRTTDGDASDFAPRAAHEMILHGYDVCSGLGVRFEPPRDVSRRLLLHTNAWLPSGADSIETSDAWSDLLARSGRAGPSA